MLHQQALASVGLVLNAAGVLILYVWQPPSVLKFLDSDGSPLYAKTGKPLDAPRSRWGIGLVLAGTLAQGAAVWM